MDILNEAARRAPDALAVEAMDGIGGTAVVRTYRELDAWADEVARALVRAGVGAGDRVGMRLPPCPEAVVLLHAVPRAGGVIVPLNPGWTQAEVMRGLAAVGRPSLMFQTMGEVVQWGSGARGASKGDVELPGPAAGQPAALLLTSGSTGVPRCVPISHRNLQASARASIERLRLGPDDRWLASLSPAHIGGLALLHRATVVGCAVVTRPRFDAAEAAELIDAGRVTHASLVPVMLSWLLEHRGARRPPETLRCLLVGGAEVPRPLLERSLELGYPVALTYGLTEATSQVTTAPPERVRMKPGSVGKALSGVRVRVPEPEVANGHSGRDSSSRAEVGEILVQGPTVVSGLASTARDDAGEGAPVHLDAEGWLHTGDLGRLDEDDDLWIVGRLSDRIVTGGVTVEPGEVEAALVRHPAVRNVAVVGVPDPRWGERVAALVVPEDPAAPPTLEDLQTHARGWLAAAKRPRVLKIVEALPRNANGKVNRVDLRALME